MTNKCDDLTSNKKILLERELRGLNLRNSSDYEGLLKVTLSLTDFNSIFFYLEDNEKKYIKSCYPADSIKLGDISNLFLSCAGDENQLYEVLSESKSIIHIPLYYKNSHFIGRLCFIKESPIHMSFSKTIKESILGLSSVLMSMIESDIENQRLKKLKKQYEAVQVMSKTGGWELDVKTSKAIWSKEVYRIHAIDNDVPLDKVDAIKYYAEHERERIGQIIENCIVNKVSFDEEFEFIDDIGNEKWVRSIGTPIIDDDGVVRKLVGTFQDITQQKNYELSLLEKHLEINEMNSHLDLALSGSGLGIWDWDLLTDEVQFDDRWLDMLGLKSENITMNLKLWEERVHPDDLECCYQDIKNYLEGKSDTYENVHRMKHAKGHWVHILDKGRVSDWDESGNPIRFTGTHLDITESRVREQELNLILREAGLGIWKFYPQTQELFWDESMYALYDSLKSDFSGAYDAWESTLADEDKEKAVKDLENALKGNSNFESKFSIITRHGERKVIGAKADIERDHDGNPIVMVGINWDITKEYEATAKLEEQALFLKSTLDSLPAMFHLKDLEGRFLMANNAYLEMYNKVETEILGKEDSVLFDDVMAKKNTDSDQVVLETMKVYEFSYEARDSDNRIKKFHTLKFPYVDKEGNAYAIGCVSIDITEKDEMEKVLNHNAKLASIGELAAGVGHEINNPLSVIKAYVSSILKKNMNLNEDIVNQLIKIDRASERIGAIVSGLRTFSRVDSNSDDNIFSIKETLTEMNGMLFEIYSQEGVTLEFKIDELSEDLYLKGRRGKFEQVLINLLSNAKDSSEGKDNRFIKVNFMHHHSELVIEIEDNGKGIKKEYVNKIYDPFYTTKNTGEGTGIGLSLVHKFITSEFDGKIDVKTKEDIGTTFKVTFPNVVCIVEADIEELSIKKEDLEIINSHLKIVVVDDEEGIREYLEDILIDLNYEVKAFENGKKALDYYLTNSDDIDLFVSDMQMSEMDGPTLLKEIRKKHNLKQPKFIFITGGINTDLNDESNEFMKLCNGFLYKPFCEENIIQKINELFQPLKKSA